MPVIEIHRPQQQWNNDNDDIYQKQGGKIIKEKYNNLKLTNVVLAT